MWITRYLSEGWCLCTRRWAMLLFHPPGWNTLWWFPVLHSHGHLQVGRMHRDWGQMCSLWRPVSDIELLLSANTQSQGCLWPTHWQLCLRSQSWWHRLQQSAWRCCRRYLWCWTLPPECLWHLCWKDLCQHWLLWRARSMWSMDWWVCIFRGRWGWALWWWKPSDISRHVHWGPVCGRLHQSGPVFLRRCRVMWREGRLELSSETLLWQCWNRARMPRSMLSRCLV